MTKMDNIKTITYQLNPKRIKKFFAQVKKRDPWTDLYEHFTDDCFYVDIVEDEERFTSWLYTKDCIYDDEKIFVNYVEKTDFVDDNGKENTLEDYVEYAEFFILEQPHLFIAEFCDLATDKRFEIYKTMND